MYKNGVTPNKEALHGAFLLNKYIFIFSKSYKSVSFIIIKPFHASSHHCLHLTFYQLFIFGDFILTNIFINLCFFYKLFVINLFL